MEQEPGAWEFSFSFSWQRLLATLLFAVGALVLGYRLIRPRVSECAGRQVRAVRIEQSQIVVTLN